jgi:nitroreductase
MLIAAKPCPDMLDYLLRRRTVEAKALAAPGPAPAEIQQILTAAARVPDHGKLFPWYFLVFEGENRAEFGAILRRAAAQRDPETSEEKLDLEAARFLRAPLVIGVISRIRESKHPAWEQQLSAGAACQNLILAANALGYATHWLTEWYAYDNTVRDALGLDESDTVAGFIYIGTPARAPKERPRPNLDAITTQWRPGCVPGKGDK